MSTLVLDNGAYFAKIGYSHEKVRYCIIMPSLLFKTFYYVIYSRYIELNAEYLFISVIPNCQFRSKTSRLKTFTANQLDEIKDPSGLFYILPFQKVWTLNFSASYVKRIVS